MIAISDAGPHLELEPLRFTATRALLDATRLEAELDPLTVTAVA